MLYLGFRTGTGLPAVLPKRVPRVRVRCCKVPTRGITVPVPAVSRVFTVFDNSNRKLIKFIYFTLFYLLYYLGGKNSHSAKDFIHFWSAHRPFVVIWSPQITSSVSLYLHLVTLSLYLVSLCLSLVVTVCAHSLSLSLSLVSRLVSLVSRCLSSLIISRLSRLSLSLVSHYLSSLVISSLVVSRLSSSPRACALSSPLNMEGED